MVKRKARKKRDYRKLKAIGKKIGKASLITAKAVYIGTKVALREEHRQSQRYAQIWSKQLIGKPQQQSRSTKRRIKRERDFIWF